MEPLAVPHMQKNKKAPQSVRRNRRTRRISWKRSTKGDQCWSPKALKANFQRFEWQPVIRCRIMITSI